MRKRGADTLLGNLWWVLDPLLQMLVYWVFVTIIVSEPPPDYPLFIFCGDPALEVVLRLGRRRDPGRASQDRLIKQIAFPKLVLPVAATTAGVVGFAFGLIPLALLCCSTPTASRRTCCSSRSSRRSSTSSPWRSSLLVSAGNVFFRDLGNVSRHVLRLWWYLSPGLYSLAALDELHVVPGAPDPARRSPASTRSPSCSRPTGR